jgi:hypothetical protein
MERAQLRQPTRSVMAASSTTITSGGASAWSNGTCCNSTSSAPSPSHACSSFWRSRSSFSLAAIFTSCSLAPRLRLDPRAQLRQLNGFDQVVVGTGAQTLVLVGVIAPGGQHDHARGVAELRVVLDDARNLPPVHTGHHDVEQHQGRSHRFQLGERFLAIARRGDRITARLEILRTMSTALDRHRPPESESRP